MIGIIPERMKSSRFPGKPIANICGKPMVQHVYENSIKCGLLDEVFVATGDKEIIDCVNGFGGKILVTRDDHYRCTNQTAEALLKYEEQNGPVDFVCMIQGDEPMVNKDMIYDAMTPLLKDDNVCVTNLVGDLDDDDVNEVKVVLDENNRALYFSRCPIPYRSQAGFMKQVCIMGFKSKTLKMFPELDETFLEMAESVDMLRFLAHNIPVLMIYTSSRTFSVDTKDDLKYVEKLLRVKK